MGPIITIIVLGILLIISGFFSATETAFSSVNIIRIKQYARSSKKNVSKKAKKVVKLSENYGMFLSTVLVGNNIVNLTSASLATYLFSTIYNMGESGVLMSTIVMSVLVIIFGEITPKTLARTWPEKFAMFAAGPMNVLVFVLMPITILFGKLNEKVNDLVDEEEKVTATEDELIDIVEKIEKEGVLEHQESELIQSAINFDSISVRQVMTSRENVMYLNVEDDFEKVADFFEYHQFSRAPVYDKETDKIIGVINQKDVYACYANETKKSARELMGDAIYVSHRRLIPYALEIIQKNKSHLAVVVDNIKEKNFLGIITLEDILEELVGDIYDEYDKEEKEFEKIDENTYMLSGSMTIYDVNKLLESHIPEGDYDTLSGYLQEEMGRIPTEEENPIIETEELTFKIEEYEDKRILKVKVCKNEKV